MCLLGMAPLVSIHMLVSLSVGPACAFIRSRIFGSRQGRGKMSESLRFVRGKVSESTHVPETDPRLTMDC